MTVHGSFDWFTITRPAMLYPFHYLLLPLWG